MQHSFNVDVAKIYGTEIAIFLNNIAYWVNFNKNENMNFYEGRYWTFNKIKSFTQHFPYWSHKQIERIINKCVLDGLLLKGCFNKLKYDRTCWYSLSDSAEETLNLYISRNREMIIPKSGNDNPEIGTPIPDINTDNKLNIKTKAKEAHRTNRDVAAVEQKIDLPDWLNKELWEEFIQYRKSIKSPMSELAQKKTITKLDKLRSEGQNIEEVINEAIINGWKGVFPIKQQKEFNHGKEKGNGNVNRNPGEGRDLQQEQTEHVKKRWTIEQREILERGAGVRWNESTARYERTVPQQAKRDVPESPEHEERLRYLDSTITPFFGLFGD